MIEGIFITGDVITPDEPCSSPEDCTCTWVHGDPTEHGHGATMDGGWIDLDWSPYVLHDSQSDVRPAIDGEELRERMRDGERVHDIVTDLLGGIDSDDGDTFYAASEVQDYRTGVTVRLAAHVYLDCKGASGIPLHV